MNSRADVQVYKPLGQGLLTSAFLDGFPRFVEGDHRSKKPWFSAASHPALLRLRHELAAVAPGHSVMEIAFAWVKQHCPTANLVVGSRTPAHVTEWVNADLPYLGVDALDAIGAAVDRYRTAVPAYLG